MDKLTELVKGLDWSPLFISIETGIVATVICFFLGIFAAKKVLSMKASVKAVVDGILTLPMVLPPPSRVSFSFYCFQKEDPLGSFSGIISTSRSFRAGWDAS